MMTLLGPSCLVAQDLPQPPGNYGLTSVLDGAPPMPGLYYMGYVQHYGSTLKNISGDDIRPNGTHAIRVKSSLLINQLSWITPLKVLGGHFEMTTVVPLVSLNVSQPYNLVGRSGIGDIVLGAGIQWFEHKLFGRPFLHRFELDVFLPIGAYDDHEDTRPVNASVGYLTVESYWAQTLMLNSKTSISLRHHFGYNRPFTRYSGLN
ncbi:MAG: transporter, partial [Bacteroidota bacterium]